MIVDRRPAHRRTLDRFNVRSTGHHSPMRATEHRIRPTRFARRGLDTAPAPAPILTPAAPTLGLSIVDLEELLLAIGDREDMAGADARARLARGRRALERELERALAQ